MCPNLSILLIDDDEANNFLTKELLEMYQEDVKVTAVTYVQDALKILSLLHEKSLPFPQVILVDLNMPDLSGWDFISAYEKLEDDITGKIKLYLYTASENELDISKANTFKSVNGIFHKPLTLQAFEKLCNDIRR